MPQFWINLHRQFRQFRDSEDGAVNTDWIVLTGAIVGLGLSATVSVRTGVQELGADISTSLSGSQVAAILVAPLAAPLRWLQTETGEISATKCPKLPDPCPNYKPHQKIERAVLELEDGKKIERHTTTSYPNNSEPIVEEVWRDADGRTIDAPQNVPDLAKAGLSCDKYGNCTSAASTPKK